MSLILALSSAIFWGVGDFFLAVSSKRFGAYTNFVITRVIGLVVLLPFAALIFPQARFNIANVSLLSGLSLMFAFSVLLFLRSLEGAQATLNGVIVSSFSVVSILVAVIFLGESLTERQIIIIGMMVVGVVFTSVKINRSSGIQFVGPTTKYAIVTAFLWGIYFAMVSIPLKELHFIWPSIFARLAGILFFPYILRKKHVQFKVSGTVSWMILICAALIPNIGDFSYYVGVSIQKTSLFVPIAATSPLIYVTLASIFFHEPITKTQKLGIAMTVFGVAMLSL